MSIFEYDEEKHMRTVRSEGFEDGLEQGIKQVICKMLRKDLSPELISQCTEQPIDYINEIKRELLSKT